MDQLGWALEPVVKAVDESASVETPAQLLLPDDGHWAK